MLLIFQFFWLVLIFFSFLLLSFQEIRLLENLHAFESRLKRPGSKQYNPSQSVISFLIIAFFWSTSCKAQWSNIDYNHLHSLFISMEQSRKMGVSKYYKFTFSLNIENIPYHWWKKEFELYSLSWEYVFYVSFSDFPDLGSIIRKRCFWIKTIKKQQ